MAGLKGLKKKRRVQVIAILFGVLAAGLGIAFFLVPATAFEYFRSPTEVFANAPPSGEVFRIGGLVETGTLVRGQSETISFSVTDTNESIPVRFTGVLPDLFAEGQGMVGTGSMEGDTFVATEILAKHDETYMPKEVVDALKAQGVYKEPKPE